MKDLRLLLASVLLLLGACQTRSLSQPYEDPFSNRTYRGELRDWDIVGTALPTADPAAGVTLRKGQRVLLLQSGAMVPDQGMREAVGTHFQVDAGSGLPADSARSEHGLRGAVARGGYDLVIAYWGTIEVEREAKMDSAAAWVPIVNIWATTSEQKARLRLRLLLLDVKNGNWRTLEVEPQASTVAMSLASQGDADTEQMDRLKAAAYATAGQALGKLLGP